MSNHVAALWVSFAKKNAYYGKRILACFKLVLGFGLTYRTNMCDSIQQNVLNSIFPEKGISTLFLNIGLIFKAFYF